MGNKTISLNIFLKSPDFKIAVSVNKTTSDVECRAFMGDVLDTLSYFILCKMVYCLRLHLKRIKEFDSTRPPLL